MLSDDDKTKIEEVNINYKVLYILWEAYGDSKIWKCEHQRKCSTFHLWYQNTLGVSRASK
jgi:hypothetical protein